VKRLDEQRKLQARVDAAWASIPMDIDEKGEIDGQISPPSLQSLIPSVGRATVGSEMSQTDLLRMQHDVMTEIGESEKWIGQAHDRRQRREFQEHLQRNFANVSHLVRPQKQFSGEKIISIEISSLQRPSSASKRPRPMTSSALEVPVMNEESSDDDDFADLQPVGIDAFVLFFSEKLLFWLKSKTYLEINRFNSCRFLPKIA